MRGLLVMMMLWLLCGPGTVQAMPGKKVNPSLLKQTILIQSGRSLDGVQLGWTLKELKAFAQKRRLSLKKERVDYIFHLGTLRILLDPGTKKVRLIQLELKAANANKLGFPALRFALQIDGKLMQSPHSPHLFAAQLGTCEPRLHLLGGNGLTCANKGLNFYWNGRKRPWWFRVDVQAPQLMSTLRPRCSGYLVRGQGFFHKGGKTGVRAVLATKKKAAFWRVREGEGFCLRGSQLTTKTTPKALAKLLPGECSTQANRGATRVFCNYSGVEAIFAGPRLVLHSLKVFHYKRLPLPYNDK
jgi:hypothetical protein